MNVSATASDKYNNPLFAIYLSPCSLLFCFILPCTSPKHKNGINNTPRSGPPPIPIHWQPTRPCSRQFLSFHLLRSLRRGSTTRTLSTSTEKHRESCTVRSSSFCIVDICIKFNKLAYERCIAAEYCGCIGFCIWRVDSVVGRDVVCFFSSLLLFLGMMDIQKKWAWNSKN